jgi:hypothetical protein
MSVGQAEVDQGTIHVLATRGRFGHGARPYDGERLVGIDQQLLDEQRIAIVVFDEQDDGAGLGMGLGDHRRILTARSSSHRKISDSGATLPCSTSPAGIPNHDSATVA